MIAGTLCRCGHLLDCCADCRAWLIEHSPKIAADWQSWLRYAWADRWPISTRQSDAAERADMAYYVSWRYSQ